MPTYTEIKKADAAKRLVFAEVYAPMRPDSDGEYMTADEIEKAAYKFMKKMDLGAIDHQHDQEDKDGCTVVESFIARKGDPDFIEGAWVVGVHVDNDDLWGKVEKGEINGFSMEAWVKKEPKEVEFEVPPILDGDTLENDGHKHRFYASYDEEGKFLGGKTDRVNGHSHVIKRGTITEEANGHTHRFSRVDKVAIKE